MSEHDDFILMREKCSRLEADIKAIESNYDSLFDYFNERFPDHMARYLEDRKEKLL